ncbi:flagellar basal body-associated protein FliL [Celerinatantimonas sp. YJH-8]|uniref:flagellar basal body-associated protein FliL n=1 Tax=Celerinatantimonas sp. YJH-8 TaxID=3228714 RepID=UPI0038C72479
MADDAELKVEESGGGKKKLLIIIILAVVILLGGGGAAYFFLFSGGDEAQAEKAAQTTTTEKAPIKEPALYVGMPRPFVFNVTGGQRDRLVQIKVQLLVRGNENEDLAKKNIPLIEGTLLRTFSAATVDQLSTPQGKDQIRDQALSDSRKALKDLTGKSVIERVLFTGFVMQ